MQAQTREQGTEDEASGFSRLEASHYCTATQLITASERHPCTSYIQSPGIFSRRIRVENRLQGGEITCWVSMGIQNFFPSFPHLLLTYDLHVNWSRVKGQRSLVSDDDHWRDKLTLVVGLKVISLVLWMDECGSADYLPLWLYRLQVPDFRKRSVSVSKCYCLYVQWGYCPIQELWLSYPRFNKCSER